MRRISSRLVISFLIVTLLPTLPLSLVVRDLLERRFGPAISNPLQVALEAGLEESRGHLKEMRLGLDQRASAFAEELLSEPIILLDGSGHVQSADSLSTYLDSRPDLLTRADNLQPSAQRLDDTLVARTQDPNGATVFLLQPLPEGMVQRAGEMTAGLTLLSAVKADEGRVVLSLVGPFLVVYAVLILVALVAAVLWSRQMVRPLELLVSATRRVSEGDLEFRMKKQGPGEVGELVHSFDTMVSRLSEQRRDLARLERAAAWRGMARTLAHEVKNPLTPILLAVNQARDKYPGDDENYRALLLEVSEIVGEEINSLRDLVREFGDFAQMPKPDLKSGNIKELLSDLQQLYGEDHLSLEGLAHCGDGWFDYNALRRAMINLIDNGLAACRQADNPAKIQIVADANQPGIRLSIVDQGIGIPKANMNRIFEPDFTTKNEGMGLGLAIVENIIIGHGGRVTVQSETGIGTTISIDLPLTEVASVEIPSEDGKS